MSTDAEPGDEFDPWADLADVDLSTANLFSAELENVDASDWDVDTAAIWGDDGGHTAVADGGAVADIVFPG